MGGGRFRPPNQGRGEEKLKHRHWVPSISQGYTSLNLNTYVDLFQDMGFPLQRCLFYEAQSQIPFQSQQLWQESPVFLFLAKSGKTSATCRHYWSPPPKFGLCLTISINRPNNVVWIALRWEIVRSTCWDNGKFKSSVVIWFPKQIISWQKTVLTSHLQ